MNTIDVAVRLTYQYVGTWKHLDDWRELGRAKLTPIRPVNTDEDGVGVYLRWATLPARAASRDDFIRGLEDSLSRNGCSHEWDCCGCVSYTTRVLHRRGRRVCLKTVASRNF